jgi:hypothetical protein
MNKIFLSLLILLITSLAFSCKSVTHTQGRIAPKISLMVESRSASGKSENNKGSTVIGTKKMTSTFDEVVLH